MKKKNLEEICKYAKLRKEKFNMTETCYDCKIKSKIICFEPYTFKDCYYYGNKKAEEKYIPGRCVLKK